MRRLPGRSVVCLALAASGCAGLVGVGDVDFQEGGAPDATSSDAMAPDAPSGTTDAPARLDGTPDGSPPADAPADAVVACPSSSRCVPAPPSPWKGPVAFYAGTSAAPTCSGDFATTPFVALNADPDSGPAQCSQCTCGTPTAHGSCNPVTVFYTPTAGCGGTECTPEGLPLDQCELETPGGCSFMMASVSVNDGTCPAAGGGAATLPPVTWGTNGAACAPTDTTACAGGGVCVPDPPAAFTQGLCIYQSGQPTCPADFPTAHVLYTSVTDNRACSACSCNYLGTCSGTIITSASNACSSQTGTIDITNGSSACLATSNAYLETTALSVLPDTCSPAPFGGQPSGTVVASPSAAVTFCCQGGG